MMTHYNEFFNPFQLASTPSEFCEKVHQFVQGQVVRWQGYGFSKEACEKLSQQFFKNITDCMQSNHTQQNEMNTASPQFDYGDHNTFDYYIRRPPSSRIAHLTEKQMMCIYSLYLLEWAVFMYFIVKPICCPRHNVGWKTATLGIICTGIAGVATSMLSDSMGTV